MNREIPASSVDVLRAQSGIVCLLVRQTVQNAMNCTPQDGTHQIKNIGSTAAQSTELRISLP